MIACPAVVYKGPSWPDTPSGSGHMFRPRAIRCLLACSSACWSRYPNPMGAVSTRCRQTNRRSSQVAASAAA